MPGPRWSLLTPHPTRAHGKAAALVYADELPADWVGGRWSGRTPLRPQYKRLPMGSTHAALTRQRSPVLL